MCRRRNRISIIVPFQSNEPTRRRNWRWLKRYWKSHIKGVQIVMGRDPQSRRRPWRRTPLAFSKTTAVNRAFKKTRGDIIVILDADAFLSAGIIKHCATRLRYARERNIHMWFVPYLHLYRLNTEGTTDIVAGDPRKGFPLSFSLFGPPPSDILEATDYGHKYGAMIQVMPREAFEAAGGMDPRFRGWGGEDVAFLHALDTLWGLHKNTPNDILHLWHPRFQLGTGPAFKVRAWDGQEKPMANWRLNHAYFQAVGKPEEMRRLSSGGPFV